VEVANTTLAYDRNIKMPLYARHGVAEAWLIDLQANRLHCFAEPADGVYQRTSTITVPGTMPLSGLPGVAVDLAGIF
jgi:Uma2 family endonuclease